MSIVAADIKKYKSSNSNSTGGVISATEIADATLNNLLPSVTVANAEAGEVARRKFFVKNTHASINWANVVIWKSAPTLSPDDEVALAIGTDTDTDGSNELLAMSADSVITLYSNDVNTHPVTLIGEDPLGNAITEIVSLIGFTSTPSVNTFRKLYNVSLSEGTTHQLITIKQGTTLLGQLSATQFSALTYYNPSSKGEGFKVGAILFGAYKGVWLKRTVDPNALPYENNQLVMAMEGETT